MGAEARERFPGREAGSRGRPPRDNRRMVEGKVWVLRAGAAWRDLAADCGPWQGVHARLRRWRKAGVWARAWQAPKDRLWARAVEGGRR